MTLAPTSNRGGSGSAGATVQSYVEITSGVSVVGTAAGTATTVVTAGAFTADGTTIYCVEFFAYDVSIASGAAGFAIVTLNEGATEIGRVAGLNNGGAGAQTDFSVLARRFITPSAGAHTYIIKAYRGTPAVTINAGTGASGTDNAPPAYVRITSGS